MRSRGWYGNKGGGGGWEREEAVEGSVLEEVVMCVVVELQGVTRKKRTATDLLVLTRLFGT